MTMMMTVMKRLEHQGKVLSLSCANLCAVPFHGSYLETNAFRTLMYSLVVVQLSGLYP
jgi:hypothetical protein